MAQVPNSETCLSNVPVPKFAGLNFGGGDEAQTQEALEHLAAIIQSSNDAIISKDLGGIVRSWNAAAVRIFGYSAEEVVGGPITILFPQGLEDEEDKILERIRRGERVEHYQTRRKRKDGQSIHVSITISPIRNRQGMIVGASKIARDITAQKLAELRLQDELQERKAAEETMSLLLHEIQHRVKNTLATVMALASQTFKSASADERRSFSARVEALAGAHALLTEENWDRAPVREIVENAIEPFRDRNDGRYEISGPDLEIAAGTSLTLSMILHELATNASKYGALTRDSGTVSIAWRMLEAEKGPLLELVWREKGGPQVAAPVRKGFGSKLIESALGHSQGHADLQFNPDGVRCVIIIVLHQGPHQPAN
jgi:PAS domain S-box-containing protein